MAKVTLTKKQIQIILEALNLLKEETMLPKINPYPNQYTGSPERCAEIGAIYKLLNQDTFEVNF